MRVSAQAGRLFVSVVMPAYNEAAIIQDSLQRVCAYLASIEDAYRWEVIVVDDGSTDNTGVLAEAFAASHPNVRVLHHFTNFKLGQSLRYGFAHCHGDYVVTIDSDLSYGPEHIGLLLEAIRKTRAKVGIASPYRKGGQTTNVPPGRRLVSRLANRFLSWMVKGRYATLTGMTRVYDRRFLNTLNLKAMDVEINTEILYKARLLRAKIVEIPAHLDWTGQTSGSKRKSSLRFKRSVLAYGFSGFLLRPLAFFTVPGLALLALSLYTLAWAGVRIAEHFVALDSGLAFDPRFSQAVSGAFRDAPHTFVVGGICLLLAVQLISLGLLSIQNKRYFEELFHLGTTIYRCVKERDDEKAHTLRGVEHKTADDQGNGDEVVPGDGLAQHVVRQREHEHLG
jgi:glycosyltransferase involved in cell wall biosynthesis